MPPVTNSYVVCPQKLDASAKEQLIERLYSVHTRIFDGVDRETFVSYVVDSAADHTYVQVHENAAGEAVGYFALHFFEKTMDGRKITVMRGEVGMISEYRGNNINARFALDQVLRYMLRNWDREIYCFACPVHPSSYSQAVRYADQVWPSHKEETPAEVVGLLQDLAREFGIRPVKKENPLVCKVGWRTRDTAADRAYWLQKSGDAAQFYLRQNPGFVEGHGLLMVAPISLGCVLRGMGRFARAKISRGLRNVVTAMGGLVPAPTRPRLSAPQFKM